MLQEFLVFRKQTVTNTLKITELLILLYITQIFWRLFILQIFDKYFFGGPTKYVGQPIGGKQMFDQIFFFSYNNLDKVLLKKLFPTMNSYKIRIFNIENRKCANVRKRPCTGLWKWSIWLGNSILSNFYLRHLILGWIL